MGALLKLVLRALLMRLGRCNAAVRMCAQLPTSAKQQRDLPLRLSRLYERVSCPAHLLAVDQVDLLSQNGQFSCTSLRLDAVEDEIVVVT